MNSPFYDNADTAMDTSPMQDGVIENQQFVSIEPPETVAPDANAGINTMFGANFLAPGYQGNIAADTTAMRIVGNQNKTFIGIMNGLAEQNNRRIEEGFLTQSAMNGLKPLEATQAKVQETVDLANATDEAVKNLSKADEELKAEQDKAKQIEQLILGTKYVEPSNQAYIQSIDQLAEMQKNAPVAPTLEQPELTTTDQALIFLAGLIGGNQQVPQAVQGAVAGAQQRAALANQMKTQRFNQEQQNYNRQLQAQQTIVGKEAQVFNQAQQTAGMNYRTELANLTRREATQDAEVAKMRAQLVKTKQTDYDRIIKAYKDMAGRQTEYTPENVKAVESAKAYLIKQLGLPEESVNATLPSVTAGQKTLKGKVMEAKQKNDDARNQIAQSKFTLFQINNVVDMVNTFLKQNTIDGVLTPTEANNLNAMYDAKAAELEKQGVKNARSLFPVIDPFTTLQKQTADQVESNRAFMRNIASSRLSLAFTRASTMSEKQPKIDGFTLEQLQKKESELNNKLQGYASAKTTIQMQYGGKQSAEYDRAIIGLEVAEAKDKGERDAIQMQIAKRTGVKPPAITQMYNDLTAIGNMFIGMAPEQKAELERIKKTYGQQAPAKASTPMLPPANTSTNPTPNPVPNPTPKPQPTPKPTTSTPKVGDKKVSPKGRTAEVVK